MDSAGGFPLFMIIGVVALLIYLQEKTENSKVFDKNF